MAEKELSFDLWGTLIQPAPTFATARMVLLRELSGCREAVATAALKGVKAEYNGLAVRHGVSTPAGRIFQDLIGRLGCRRPHQAVMEAYYELFQTHPPLLLETDLPALLASWSARYRLHLISNTLLVPGTVLTKSLNSAYDNLLKGFCSLTFSDEVGYSKPHRNVFAHAYAWMRVAKKSVTHIGNDPHTDIYGAQRFGFQALLVDYSKGVGLRQAFDTLGL